jgi:hypothetical protein
MALILKDRVKETSSSSGTGNITLGGAFPGYQTFNAVIASGSTVYYTIHNLTAGVDNEWEVGVGTFTSPATLARTTVISSSTGSAINFTAGASGLEVFITQPAEEAVYLNNATGKVEVGGNGTNVVTFTEINTTNLTANTVTLTAGTITTNAANATDITNKQYVDGLVLSGTHFHEPVLVEEDINLVAVYNQPNGAGNGVGATLTNNAANAALVVDGVSVSNTARILVYAQSNAVQNGVYTVTNPGNASAQWVLTRSTDTDTYGLASSTELSEGSTFFVTAGNTGAGRTYTCNTQGTITFGSTNITFAQISSAQIYSAGTGLNLSNLTFSIANTTVVSGLYGDSANVSVIEVNAQGQLTSAANSAINVSNITVGTLSNDRTTASASNGANTIVLRDANGNFTANVITATTSNATTFNGTTGNFTNITGNAVALTDINASNITSGTISNARTTGNTANSASTIVLRDANGAFAAGNVTAANFIGAGTTITSINASNISSGTIANARTTADSANGASTIVARDSSGSFTANVGTFTSISGNGVSLSAINASNITSGTIANARTTAATANGASTIVLRGASGEFAAGAVTGTSFSGDGSSITAINASSISSGTIANARTTAASANGASTIVSRGSSGEFSAGAITATSFSGSGASLTSIPNGALVNSSTTINGTAIALGSSGTITAANPNALTIGTGLSGTSYNGSSAVTVALTNTGVGAASYSLTSLTVDAQGRITAASSGSAVTSAAAGTGISVSGATGAVTFTNTGVTSAVAGTGVSVSGATGAVTFSIPQAVGTGSSVQFGSFGVGTAASGTTGEIRATNNVTAFYSDERLKTKTGDIENALDKVCQIETMLYHANETAVALGYDASIQEVGVTAQSVQKVQPEIVVPAPIDDKYLTVRYEKLVPLLIEAIKELKAEIDALKGK